MEISRRRFLGTAGNLGVLAATSSVASAIRPLTGTIDDTVANPNPISSGNADEGRIFADYIIEAQKMINSSSNSKSATENVRLYRQAFDTYEKAIQYAKDESDLSWANPKRLTYTSWEIVARMWQAKLLNGTASMNIMKEGEIINVKGLGPIKASGRRDSPGYNYLKALQDYDKVEDIFEEMEANGKKFPSSDIGLGLGNIGAIADRSLVRKKIYGAFEGAIREGISVDHEKALLKRWADTIEQNKKTGEAYFLDKLAPSTRMKLEPYLTRYKSIISK